MQLGVERVTAEFFDVLGTPPALGRTFTAATEITGERVVVIGDEAWDRLFARNPAAIGQRIRVNGEPCTVIAVMPKRFEWLDGATLWLLAQKPVPPSPLDVKDGDSLTNRDSHYFEAVARLKPGVTLAQAQQDLHTVATLIDRDHPMQSGRRDVQLVPIRENLTGDVRQALLVIQGAVGLVLLIACANVSSLLIARAAGRRRELTIRAALGASRGALVAQLLAESAVLGLAGGVIGLVASVWLVGVLVNAMPEGLPNVGGVSTDVTVMLVALATALLTSLVFGVLPALQASRVEAAQVLKQTGDRGSSRSRGRAWLVAGEIALTLVLLAGAGMLGNSFLRLQRVDSGFAVDHATVADLMLPQVRYARGQTRRDSIAVCSTASRRAPTFRPPPSAFPARFTVATPAARSCSRDRTPTRRGNDRAPTSPPSRAAISRRWASRASPAASSTVATARRRRRSPSSTPLWRTATGPGRARSASGSVSMTTRRVRGRPSWAWWRTHDSSG